MLNMENVSESKAKVNSSDRMTLSQIREYSHTLSHVVTLYHCYHTFFRRQVFIDFGAVFSFWRLIFSISSQTMGRFIGAHIAIVFVCAIIQFPNYGKCIKASNGASKNSIVLGDPKRTDMKRTFNKNEWKTVTGASPKSKRLKVEPDGYGLYVCPVEDCDSDSYKSQRDCRKHVFFKHGWYYYFDKISNVQEAFPQILVEPRQKCFLRGQSSICGRNYAWNGEPFCLSSI